MIFIIPDICSPGDLYPNYMEINASEFSYDHGDIGNKVTQEQ